MPLNLAGPVTVAAVQMEGRVGDMAFNLDQAEKLAVEAFDRQAKIVALPEFFTTPVVFDERVRQCALPERNDAIDMLKKLARRYSGYLGGSLLLRKGAEVYNTYVFVQPNGDYFLHDKDLPTMWENAFYRGGQDDGVMATEIGPVGAAVCWELIRTRTLKRLRGRINFAITGSNWWTVPDWKFAKLIWSKMHKLNVGYVASAPAAFAKLLGVPVLHAAHAGRFEGRMLVLPGASLTLPFRSTMMGESQIVDGDGSILAKRVQEQGRGIITAAVLLKPRNGAVEIPDRYWVPDLHFLFKAFWHQQRLCGKWYYLRAKKRATSKATVSPASAVKISANQVVIPEECPCPLGHP